jgi:hypothetical protein
VRETITIGDKNTTARGRRYLEIKGQAARRWANAVNADGTYGEWHYAIATKPEEVAKRIDETVLALQSDAALG